MKFLNKSILIAIVLMASSTYFNAMEVQPKNAPKAALNIAWGVSERQGVRPTMEDAYAYESMQLGESKAYYFGIFDGHGGARAADFAGQNAAKEFHDAYLDIEEKTNPLMQSMYFTPKENENPFEIVPEEHPFEQYGIPMPQETIIQNALKRSYLLLDQAMQQQFTDGTAAISAVIDRGNLYLAWTGDCRAVVADANGHIKKETIDHKPNLPSEEARIKKAGGEIYFQGAWRVNGLAMSRSLGDKSYKKNPYVIVSIPEIITMNDLQKGDIIILACDGIWDVMQNEEAVQFVKESLDKSLEELKELPRTPLAKGEDTANMKNDGNNEKLVEIARALRDHARDKKSSDNISVMIIQIQ